MAVPHRIEIKISMTRHKATRIRIRRISKSWVYRWCTWMQIIMLHNSVAGFITRQKGEKNATDLRTEHGGKCLFMFIVYKQSNGFLPEKNTHTIKLGLRQRNGNATHPWKISLITCSLSRKTCRKNYLNVFFFYSRGKMMRKVQIHCAECEKLHQ